MKNLLPFLFILCFSLSLTAQVSEKGCDTIVLQNKREILAHIDSMHDGILYYRPCPEDNGLTRTMPVSYIKRIKGNSAAVNAVPLDNEGKILRKKSDLITQAWTFRHLKEGKVYTVPATREVKIYYKENRVKKQKKGHIISMEGDSVLFQTKRFGLISVPKAAVTEISIRKQTEGLGILVGVMGIIVGIAAVAMVLLLALLAISLSGNPSNAASDSGYQSGCLLGALGIGLGILIIIIALPKSIQAPFSDRWEIVETGAPPIGNEAETTEKP